ncbi:MAG: Hpt domain-containing protein, partial [Actinomycetota bacterium]|nr:Hpt domain-containing protein [Actinomycetota bacterium]
RLPIIAMTAGALDEDREPCLAAGMDDYLAKPVDLATLDETLARWVPRTTPPEGQTPAVDPVRLATLRALGAADGHGLLPAAAKAFRRDVPSSLAALHQALTNGGADALGQAAHKLRGAAANIGANHAAALCEEVERLGYDPDGQSGPELMARLQTELARVDTALDHALSLRS